MLTCLITGCCLILPHEEKAAWGDLHCLDGHTYIFNATLNHKGETHWEYPEFFVGRPALTVHQHAQYFERRGVIVVSDDSSELNLVASQYLAKTLKHN